RQKTKLAIAAAADYFYRNKFVGAFVSAMLNTFPFDRQHPRQGLVYGKEILRSGKSLLIFPEGTRAKPADHLNFKRGFAALACQLGLPVVPIHIDGSYEMMPKGTHFPRRASIHISFGKPLIPSGRNSSELAMLAQSSVENLAAA